MKHLIKKINQLKTEIGAVGGECDFVTLGPSHTQMHHE